VKVYLCASAGRFGAVVKSAKSSKDFEIARCGAHIVDKQGTVC
jgi:hypothetical protein